jgi:hypothetical protein
MSAGNEEAEAGAAGGQEAEAMIEGAQEGKIYCDHIKQILKISIARTRSFQEKQVKVQL